MEKTRFLIEYDQRVFEQLNKIPKNILARIKLAIEERLCEDPMHVGKPLVREWKNHRRIRIGMYRVIYKVYEDRLVVFIVKIDHRKDVYETQS